MPAPSDPLADYSGTEREIFDAALEGFVRDGRHGARMQAIADTVGLNKAILHYYFQGKATLYEEGLGYTIRRFPRSASRCGTRRRSRKCCARPSARA
jgi:Bacterial regulatory proteins, tetR family.